jgi:hypothetical protein
VIYAKVDVKLRDHERAHRAGVAMATWTWALLYVREQETDGFIPDVALRGAWVGEKDARKHAATLCLVGLWEKTDGGWRISKYDSKNDTKASIDARRAEARERMGRVRANRVRTSHEPTESEQRAVPGSRSGSVEVRDQSGVLSRPASVRADPATPPPDWWAGTLATIEQNTGVKIPAGESWLRYAGHRGDKGGPPTPGHATYWLTSVVVKEARDKREADRRQAERDAKFDRSRSGPEPPPKPTPEQSKQFAAELAARVAARKAKERGAA